MPGESAPCRNSWFLVGTVPAAGLALLEALTAIDWLVAAWLERNFRRLAAGRADGREHLAWAAAVAASTAATAAVSTAAAAISVALGLASCAACRAALWLRETTLCIEGLLAGSEIECCAAIPAGQCTIAHREVFPFTH